MFVMVIRRYKYLQKALEAEMTKLLLFLKAFSTENKTKLAKLFAFLLDEGVCPWSAYALDCMMLRLCYDIVYA